MDTKLFEQSVAPFEQWATEDKEHRAVIVLTIDDSEGLESAEYICGSEKVVIPALAWKKMHKEDSAIGALLNRTDGVLARMIVSKLTEYKGDKEDKENESHNPAPVEP